jgi:hypothetical protein
LDVHQLTVINVNIPDITIGAGVRTGFCAFSHLISFMNAPELSGMSACPVLIFVEEPLNNLVIIRIKRETAK